MDLQQFSSLELSLIFAVVTLIFFILLNGQKQRIKKEKNPKSNGHLDRQREKILKIFEEKDKIIEQLHLDGKDAKEKETESITPPVLRGLQKSNSEPVASMTPEPVSKTKSDSPLIQVRRRSMSVGHSLAPLLTMLEGSQDSDDLSTGSNMNSHKSSFDKLESETSSVKKTPIDDVIFGFGLMPGSNEAGTLERQEYHTPTIINNMDGKSVIQIGAGGEHALFLSDTGDVYNWGGLGYGGTLLNGREENIGPRLVPSLALEKALSGHRIQTVACGASHSVVVNEIGEVYTWGDGGDGRLGHGDTLQQVSPKKVLSLIGTKISLIACGGAHSIAISVKNIAYTWGRGNNGRLGHDDVKSVFVPSEVNALRSQKIVSVACGHNFTVCVNEGGGVYCWGKGDQGQCGYKYAQDQLSPRKVDGIADECVQSVSCGYLHTLALCRNGNVYSWGHGEHGQLGLPRSIYQPEPANISISEYLPSNDRIVQISCGTWHSMALSQSSIVLSWGKNLNGVLGSSTKELPFSSIPKIISTLPSHGILKIVAGRDFSFVLKEGNRRRRNSTPKQFLSSPELSKRTSDGVWRSHTSYNDNARLEKAQNIKVNNNITAWKEIILDWEGYRNSQKIIDLYRKGIPPSMRNQVWPLAIGNQLKITPQLFAMYRKRSQIAKQTYLNVDRCSSSTPSSTSSSLSSPYLHIKEDGRGQKEGGGIYDREESMNLINVDLPRTFPELRFFGGGEPFYDQLREVLETFVCYRPDLGYIQGMSYLAAMICIYEPEDIYLSFQSLSNLLASHHLFVFYSIDRELIGKYCKIFDYILKENNISIWGHLRYLGISHEMYLFPWLQTLFLKNLPLTIASRVWDCFLFEGTLFMLKVAVSILTLLSPVLDGVHFEDAAALLTSSNNKKILWDKYVQEGPLFKAIGNVICPKIALKDLNSLSNDPYFFMKSNMKEMEVEKKTLVKVDSSIALYDHHM